MIRIFASPLDADRTIACITATLNVVPKDRRPEHLKKLADFHRARMNRYQESVDYHSKLETWCDKEACDIEDREEA